MTDDTEQIDESRSHAQRETIAYCPECQKELDDFELRTKKASGAGRCRSCGSVAWMSFEAQELLTSDYVTLSGMREARSMAEGGESA